MHENVLYLSLIYHTISFYSKTRIYISLHHDEAYLFMKRYAIPIYTIYSSP